MDIKQRMQAVLRAEAEAINAIDVSQDFVTAVEVMQACKGKILTTGIGKAGHIAKKFAATLCSTATQRILFTLPRRLTATLVWLAQTM